MTDAELIQVLRNAFTGISTCSTCGACRSVAELMLQTIEQHLAVPVYEENEFPGPPACVGGQCGEE